LNNLLEVYTQPITDRCHWNWKNYAYENEFHKTLVYFQRNIFCTSFTEVLFLNCGICIAMQQRLSTFKAGFGFGEMPFLPIPWHWISLKRPLWWDPPHIFQIEVEAPITNHLRDFAQDLEKYEAVQIFSM